MLEFPNRISRSHPRALAALAVFVTALASIACERSVSAATAAPPVTIDPPSAAAPGDDSLDYPTIPDPSRTPGAVFDVTAADVCVPGYSKKVRDVPVAVKRRAYAMYDVRTHQAGEYEIDHLISLQLGGSNSIRNLWPQSFRTHPWNAYVKDALEVELHRRVCAGAMALSFAQHVIAHNWVIGYRTYVSPTPLPAGPRAHASSRRHRRAPRDARSDAPVP
jgi:hypothetical protein